MAKRFTDSEKWRDPWFCGLAPAQKHFWIYLCDNCDHAGVWKVNLALARFHLGPNGVCKPEKFGDRIKVLRHDKWWLTRFVEFQYGPLNPENKAHKGVLSILLKEGLSKGLGRGLAGAKDKDTEKDKVTDTDAFKAVTTTAEVQLESNGRLPASKHQFCRSGCGASVINPGMDCNDCYSVTMGWITAKAI